MRRNLGKIASTKKARAGLLVVLLGTTAAGVVAQVEMDGAVAPAPAPEAASAVIADEAAPVVAAEVELTVEADAEVVAEPEAAPEPEEDAEPAIDLMQSLEMIQRGDIIRRQALISERKLILDREAQLIASIQSIVKEVGMEGLEAFYPELAVLVKDSPLALRAEIDKATLQAKLIEVAEEAKAVEEPAPAPAPTPAPVATGSRSLMDAVVAPVGATVENDPLAEMRAREAALEELRRVAGGAEEQAEAETEELPGGLFRNLSDIQVIEIYGMSNDLQAVIAKGPSVTSTVRAGDEIRNATILDVGPSGITVSLDLDPRSEGDEPLEGRVAIRR